MVRRTLTDKGVHALKPRAARYAFPDPALSGHYVRVQPSGSKSYVAVTLDPRGRQVWTTLGSCDVLGIEEARRRAREVIQRVRDGLPAVEPPANTFEEIAEQWLVRHVRARRLRSEAEITRLLRAHVYPAWKGRALVDIRRSDVAALLDEVEDDHGARQADYVLALVRQITNWYATRSDSYAPPVVKGMRRTSPKERARSRVLTDNELGEVWRAAEANGTFGAFLRLLLLTAQRRRTVAAMRWDDVKSDGTWMIPTLERQKGTGGDLLLPTVALEIIRSQPRIGSNSYVLAGRANSHIGGWSKPKAAFDAQLKGVAPYVLHDLRRSARSLMSRAGVRPDIAERVLGHAIGGVEGVYDRHAYKDEKAGALKRLAALIESIVHARSAAVLPMKLKGKRRKGRAGFVVISLPRRG
jgi:integrase